MTPKPLLITQASWVDMAFFFGPLAIMYLVFYVFSLGFLLYTSLHRVNISPTGGRWVGFDNFLLLLTIDARVFHRGHLVDRRAAQGSVLRGLFVAQPDAACADRVGFPGFVGVAFRSTE